MTDWTTSSRIKVERAKEHIMDLDAKVRAFLERRPYEPITQEDPQTGERIWRVQARVQPDIRWGCIAGDAIHNLRSALDVLVYQLAFAKTSKHDASIKFPISESAKYFETRDLPKVQAAGAATVKLLKKIKPYKGGNDDLYRLHRLDITDKHHVLLMVGSSVARARLLPTFGGVPAGIYMDLTLGGESRRYPLKDGAEIFRLPGFPNITVDRAHMEMDIEFAFEVAFGQGEILEGEPIIPTLHQLTDMVQGIVESFALLPTGGHK